MSVFPSIRIEGGLLGPDVLDQLLAADLPGQKAADFGIEARRNLNDEIAAVFADARALWRVFQNRLARLPETDIATSLTRELWMIPFLNLLGYAPQYNQRAFDVDGLSFALSHRADEAAEAPPLHIVGARQELGRLAPSGRPRLSPHALVQEYLNRTEHLWSFVTNGVTLRLLRDSTFVRRQAYIEFDLAAILEEQRFQDFAALYRLLHRSRLPRTQADASECLLEKYYAQSVEQGDRVRDRLRDGVKDCLEYLANGFLQHGANADLRQRVAPPIGGNERISAEEFYRQLLRLVYRFLFLLVSEDRGLVSPDSLYREHYGIARLRRMLDRRAAYDDHDDLWQSLRVLWKVFGDERLAEMLQLAPLNGELFAPQFLDACTITNRDLLTAFYRLAWYRDERGNWRRVNYAALDVEELGSVYESLLEFHPAVEADAMGRLNFQLLFGSERKTTGSYYTPPQLVNELIQSALEPVLAERLSQAPTDEQKKKAILSIRICDPACGSGHFLLAAARRLGKELARLRTGEDEPAPEALREATRDVIAHCIYGVDKNPLAVDLCRVALWIESHTSGKPLTFLDHRILPGDSLVGVFDLNVLKPGIPDEAFKPLEGDDKTTAREMARRNRDERGGQRGLFDWNANLDLDALSRTSHAIDEISDDSPALIREKKRRYEQSRRDPAWLQKHEACNLWTAAFFQSLQPDQPAITSAAVADRLAGQSVDPRVTGSALVIAERERFFHWPLEFAEVFAEGGFDVLLSNPPWERIKLQEQEFFAARDARIATAPNKAARARLIRELPETNPALYAEYVNALRSAAGASQSLRHSGRFPLTGRGDINTYAVFAELARNAVRTQGRAGIIVPSGIATDDTTKFFFGDLVQSGSLVSLFDFENRKKIFAAVDSRMKFALLTMRAAAEVAATAEFVFFALGVDDLRREEKRFTLTADEIALLNPNTGNCPIFRTQADAELAKAIYRRVPVLWREARENQPESNPWRLSFNRMFDMANDSRHFRTAQELEADGYRREGNVFVSPHDRYLPLYEAKMLHQFDHRWATYENAEDSRDVTLTEKRDPNFVVQPRYWVREEVVESAIPRYPEPLALALSLNHRPSVKRVLCYWAAGQQLLQGNTAAAQTLLDFAVPLELDRPLGSWFARLTADEHARQLAQDFPLSPSDLEAIAAQIKDAPEEIAQQLVERFSPKWFLGWRDICRSTDERTLIANAVPRVAVGDKFLLIFSKQDYLRRLCLLANLDSFVTDYCSRQKVGGISFKYFTFKQIAILRPEIFEENWAGLSSDATIGSFVAPRVLELIYTAQDLAPLARECGYDGPPFVWDEARRFELRCELDAAFFHLYLPSEADGVWRVATGDWAVVDETPEQLSALRRHFPTPRDAVSYILDQFPIVRQKDEAAHGRYRTKERILEIYDALQAAQTSDRPYRSESQSRPL